MNFSTRLFLIAHYQGRRSSSRSSLGIDDFELMIFNDSTSSLRLTTCNSTLGILASRSCHLATYCFSGTLALCRLALQPAVSQLDRFSSFFCSPRLNNSSGLSTASLYFSTCTCQCALCRAHAFWENNLKETAQFIFSA